MTLDRRQFLINATLALAGCDAAPNIQGGFNGVAMERGHLLRTQTTWPAPAVTHHTDVLIAGAGVTGLAAARALRQQGVENFALLELEDTAGGNSRSSTLGGTPCPLGAHYLPVPNDAAWEVQDLLEELGLRTRQWGRWVMDERHLCHSPQERLFFRGAWQDGLLPLQDVGTATLAQYQQFSKLITQLQLQTDWTIPIRNKPLAQVKRALAAITFEQFLQQNQLTDPHLLWYLNYCCRDDYGAGVATVSAWAGVHYFASRHGFAAPGAPSTEREGLLTWPQGNGWLTERLAAPLGDRLHTGQVVLRIAQVKHAVEVDVYNTATRATERWQASRAIVALPIFVAARVLENPPQWLQQAAAQTVYAPWLVANISINAALQDRPGAPPSWDNVLYGDAHTAPGLGYVDAKHQQVQSVPGATVLTYYRALGDAPLLTGATNMASPGVSAAQRHSQAARRWLHDTTWVSWRDRILTELAQAHSDLPSKTTHIALTRYGHAMAVPVPNIKGQIGLERFINMREQLSKKDQWRIRHGRLTLAHSDWAGYSVFEEAFIMGHWAA